MCVLVSHIVSPFTTSTGMFPRTMGAKFTTSALMTLAVALPLVALPAAALSGTTSDGAAANNQEFDYIVIGGGLAGLTVANRLSELEATVLCVERG